MTADLDYTCINCGKTVGYIGCPECFPDEYYEEIAHQHTTAVMDNITADASLCVIREALMEWFDGRHPDARHRFGWNHRA